MRKVIVARILCLCMILSLFAGFNIAKANETKGEYIVHVDVSRFSPNFEEAFSKKDYDKAVELADRSLNIYEEQILELLPNLEIISKTRLLLPAFVVKASKDDLAKLTTLAGIKEIYPNRVFSDEKIIKSDMDIFRMSTFANGSLQMVSSNDIIGNNEALQEKYSGRGRVLAIADGNMDPSHAVFYLSKDTKPKFTKRDINNFIQSGKLHVKDKSSDKSLYNSVYRSEKIPFGWHYTNSNTELNPDKEQAAHGQHVSGTVGGNKYNLNGKIWRGVAPEAQLLMMNIFFNGAPREASYIQAMEDAMVMGADAVNLSLASAKGVYEEKSAVREAIDKCFNSNTNIVIAAGNDGDFLGDLNIDAPDYGNISTPGIATNGITVASLENKNMYSSLLTYEGQKYLFATSGKINFKDGMYDFVDCGLGKPEDFAGKDLDGKIALVKRGSITFNDKVANASKNKAVGVIIYNNADGVVNMSIDKNTIPVMGTELRTGEKMISGSSKTVYIDNTLEEIKNPSWGEMSKFSNWGLSSGGFMKPDITAPGGHIYSTQTMGNTFGDMSGTSMATPHVTGAVALIRERLEEPIFAGASNKAALTKLILMNSAVPHQDIVTGQTTSPRRQGAGVMNITKAVNLDFTAMDRDTKIASKFVGNVDDKITLNLIVRNYSNKTKKITPSIQATIEARDGKKLLRRPDELFSKTYNDKTFEVAPQSETEFNFTFDIEQLDKVKDFTNGAFIEGFLFLRDQDAMEISLPFVSFKGEYETIPSIEKPIYDFDFTSEEPMYWNIASVYSPWHKFSTHIETNQGKTIDEKGKSEDKLVIAGLKNFDDIDMARKTLNAKKPKPVFTKLVFSPNGDGFNDIFTPVMVMTRTANVLAQILSKDDGLVKLEKNYRTLTKTISNNPDDVFKLSWTKGYAENGSMDIKGLADGEYTLQIKSGALKTISETYPETSTKMDFIIDTKAPEFTKASYDEAKKTFGFEIKELNDIGEIKITAKGKVLDYTEKEGKINFTLTPDIELKDVIISASDIAYNKSEYPAEYILNKDVFGSLKLDVKAKSLDELKLVYKVYDKDNNICEDLNYLKIGKYKLKIEDFSKAYELKGENEIDFEITESDKNKEITVNFERIYISNFKVQVRDMADLDPSEFKVFVKSLDSNEKFELKGEDNYSRDLRYGKYELSVEFVPNRASCKAKFDSSMPYTINREKQVLGLRIINDDQYQINVESAGIESASEVKYIAKRGSTKRVIGTDILDSGTWTVYPEKMPEGYFTTKPFSTVKLSKEDSKQSVKFDYKKINGKFTLNVNDNYAGAMYRVFDFYAWLEKGKGTVLEYSSDMQLDPGFYMIRAIETDEAYGETTFTEDGKTLVKSERTFTSEGEDVNLAFDWTIFGQTDKIAKTNISFSDSSKATSYELILRGSKGQEYRVMLEGTRYGQKKASIDLKYDRYTLIVKNIDSSSILDKNEFTVMSEEAEIKFRAKRSNNARIAIKVNFLKGQDKVDNVKYKLGLNTFNETDIKVTPNIYTIELIEPENIILKNDKLEYTVDNTTREINVEVLDKPQDQLDRERNARMQKLILKTDASDIDLANLDIKVLDARKNNVTIEKESNTIKFEASKGSEYQILIKNDALALYPNFIKASLGDEAKIITITKALKLDIKAMASDKELMSKFKISAMLDENKFTLENLEKVPHLGSGKIYKVEIFDLENGYRLKEANTKEIVLKDGYEYKLVFECEVDLNTVPANRDELQALVDKYDEVLSSKKYINASDEEKSNYQRAIVEADKLLTLQDLTQEEANKAVKAIKEAYDKLSGVENPADKTDAPSVTEAYINDKYVRGRGINGATVYYKLVEKGQDPDQVDIKAGMKIFEDGSFSIEVGRIIEGDRLYMYQKENNKLMSDPVLVNILELDKTKFLETIKEVEKIVKSDEFKNSPLDVQKDLENELNIALELRNDEYAAKEDIDKSIEGMKRAIAAIGIVIPEVYEITFDPNNGERPWTEIVRQGEKVKEPARPYKPNHTFIAWQFNGENYNFNTSVMENIRLVAAWLEDIPAPKPYEPIPEPYEPAPRPHKPYRPYRPQPKPEEKKEEANLVENKQTETKPVETKEDLGIITEYPINPVELEDIPQGPEGEAVRNLVSYGIIKGMGNGKFQGNETITRAMVTRVFMLISKDKYTADAINFTDVKDTSWYAQSVKWAATKNIIKGYTDGTFKAEKKVTRQEFCVMLMNLLKVNGIELENVVPVDEEEFAKADSWAKDAIIAMKRAGLVHLEASGKLSPKSEFTREELAKAIDLLIKLIKIKEQ